MNVESCLRLLFIKISAHGKEIISEENELLITKETGKNITLTDNEADILRLGL